MTTNSQVLSASSGIAEVPYDGVWSMTDRIPTYNGVAIHNLVTITDMSGQTLVYEKMPVREEYDLGHLPAGIYILNAYTDTGVLTRKLNLF